MFGASANTPTEVAWPQPHKFNTDIAKAKQLMAEAGYPNGFEMRLTSWGPNRPLAELVSGELHKVGIKASVEHLIYSVYAQKARNGENQAMVTWWDNGSNNDVDVTTTYWFSPDNDNRDYTLDSSLHAATEKGRLIFDPAARQAHYKQMFDKVNEQIYMVPLVATPVVTVHHKDLVVRTGYKEPLVFNYLEWAK
jgi:peptide/nickel transport system substrate-binding protein